MHLPTLTLLATAVATSSLAAQWQLASPTTSPSARYGHALAYDGSANRVLLFGGSAGFSTSNETWAYDGSNWQQLSPTASPNGHTGIDMVHDLVRGVTLMYGGMSTSFFGGPSVDQTWEFDGTTWTQVFPTTTPGGLGNYGMAYDLLRQRVVLYGGSSNSFFPIAEAGTWEFDGTNWALRTPATNPGPLERPAMCFHQGLGRTVLFGGIDPQIGGNDTTWLYDGTNWTAAPVTGARPSVRTGAKMAYDSVRGVCVLSGGVDPMNGQPIVDTWQFDGASWTQVPTVNSGRYAHGMAFLPTTRQVVLFGGSNPATFSDLGDTWLHGSTATDYGSGCLGTNGVPQIRAVDAPRLGTNYTLNMTNLPLGSGAAFVAVGYSNVVSVLGALPYPLDSVGMPGCASLTSADASFLVAVTSGTATTAMSIPNDVAFVALQLYHQVFAIDTAANVAGATASNAVAGVVGL
jgi:hypothetical protein